MKQLIAMGLLAVGLVAAGAVFTPVVEPPQAATTCQDQAALMTAINGNQALSGCYDVTTVYLTGRTGLVVNGNGATLEQATGAAKVDQPILWLTGDTGLTINNLTLHSAGGPSGSAYEGDAGVVMEGVQTATLTNVNVENVQGDAVELLPDYKQNTDQLNTGITWTGSTLSGGYHGVTPEAVNGLVMTDDTIEAPTDAIDAEADIYSTRFVNGQPTFAAEDNMTFSDDTFKWGVDLFSSIQGQSPGVQEQNVKITSNTLASQAPLLQIVGTNTTATQYQFSGFTFSGNQGGVAHGTSSAATNARNGASTMTIANAYNITIQQNYLNVYYYGQFGPYLDVLKANHVTGLNFSANGFPGAYDVLNPASSGNAANVCANRYGVAAALSDWACP